jgi:hypothetical protein
MKAPTCIKDVQKLTGCMAALNRFISKLGERGLPFFKLLKHQEKFVWTPEADQALAQLKDFLSKTPVLTAPRKGEQLLLYLAATTHVVSTAIVVERHEDGHAYPVQRPVYFVNEVLSESKARYQPVQKLLYAVLITSGKLRHYFQEYSISVVTDYPLGDILGNQDATGRISKWAVELGALTIDFKPRTAMKSQALVDFMAEWRENQLPTPTVGPEHWVMYFDGSLNLEGAGAGVLLISPTGEHLKYVKSYVLVGDKLYKRGTSSGVLMKCIPRQEGKDILEEIHKGVCGNHASSRTLVSKAFRRAFYWPTALGDAEELVRRCQGCQYFAKQQHVPAYKLVTIPPTWPFACWGLEMIGPLPTAPGGFHRVLVAIDKFTKWIEVKPVTCPKADRVLDFLDELVHRYGLPHRIITDLGSNFNNH